jgi:hypothetical protein
MSVGMRFNPGAVSCNIDSALQRINDAYECAEKVGLSWWLVIGLFRLPSVEAARPASVR